MFQKSSVGVLIRDQCYFQHSFLAISAVAVVEKHIEEESDSFASSPSFHFFKMSHCGCSTLGGGVCFNSDTTQGVL